MQGFEQIYMRTLRHLYDTETQIFASLGSLSSAAIDPELVTALTVIEEQSRRQAERLEEIFRVLYQEPRGEAAWVATALLRQAWEAASTRDECGSTEACAAALLALKRYELTLYEALLRWSERCDLHEALPVIRRAIAEEILQASVLAGFAFKTGASDDARIISYPPIAIH